MGFILGLLGILFVIAISFIAGGCLLIYCVLTLVSEIPVEEFINILNEYKEKNITDQNERATFFRSKFEEISNKYGVKK